MRAEDLLDVMMRPRFDLDDNIVVPVETLGASVGGHPFVSIKSVHSGIDWDMGRVFLTPAEPLVSAGESFRAQQESARETSEKLGWVLYVLGGSLEPSDKLREIEKILRPSRGKWISQKGGGDGV